MAWIVEFAREFLPELDGLAPDVKDELLAHAQMLSALGPRLGRPRVGTLNGSKHSNMKELRFRVRRGVWRVAFAFDPRRHAIVLVAGDKSGVSQRHFYEHLISRADRRYDAHLERHRN